MSEECFFLNPLRRDGASQRQRLTPALRPSSVAIDERRLSDLLLYVRDYAKLLRYYSPDNSPGGDWSGFFAADPSLLVATVAGTDPEEFRTGFEAARDALDDALAADADSSEKEAAFAALFPPIVELAETFDGWYLRSTAGLSLRRALERLFGAVLSDAARGVLAVALRAAEVGLPVAAVDTSAWSDAWGLSEVESDPSFFPSGAPVGDKELEAAAGRLERLFERLYEALTFLVAEAPSYLSETLTGYAAHPPHMALLLAFLELLEHARDHLNTLTEAHLDFYYQRVLGLKPRAPEPDKVHLLFELAKGFDSHSLAAGTLVKAGKDASGVELLYGTDEELVVNRARLDPDHGLKTVYVEMDGGVVENIYAAPDADSADGAGAAIEDEEGKWETFGSRKMPPAEIGFAVASPMFLLSEGTRTITLGFGLAADPLNDDQDGTTVESLESELESNVAVYASGEKEWLEVAVDSVDVGTGSEPSLTWNLKVEAGDEAIVAYDDEVLGDGFDTERPVLKFILDNEDLSAESPPQPYPYKYLQSIEVKALEIGVEVGKVVQVEPDAAIEGVRSLILENDVGVLNPAKPFQPFGPVPKKESSFLLGSHEVFQKGLTGLRLSIEWADLPAESFADHYTEYAQYAGNNAVESNDDFTATLSVLLAGTWQPPAGERKQLFTTLRPSPPDDDTPEPAPESRRDIVLTGAPGTFPRDADLAPFDRFDPTLRRGFLRATLDRDFLHGLYAQVLAEVARDGGNFPNQPYTPLMASLTLHYRATEIIDYGQRGKDDFDDRVEKIFQLWPFGHREIFPIADDESASGVPISRKLVPEFTVTIGRDDAGEAIRETAEGTLLIGLDGLVPPQNLALLFQVAEGSEDPEYTPQEVVWSYLADDEWVDFETAEVLADSTGGLLRSGIVKLATPQEMSAAKTVLPAGRHWIKASVREQSQKVPKLIAVHPQAVAASFRDRAATGRGNDPRHLETALAAGTIGKLKSRVAAVKSLTQPYASFGGRPEESGEPFYTRVSERLRHRGRAVAVFDYERLVLERFPEVYKVRCLNHSRPASQPPSSPMEVPRCEHAPGHVEVVVVPDLRNRNAVDPLRPRLSLAALESIREYLAELASDFVSLVVRNPDYETIRVGFNVRFRPGRDQGSTTAQLEQDIIGFLSPWLHDDAADLTFGGRIHRSAILDFVEERDYVDFVTDFRMFHIVEGQEPAEVEVAEATTSSAALVSAESHDVGHDIESCEDRGQG